MAAARTPLRVAHVVLGRCNPDSPNGVDKTAYYLSRAMAKAGLDVLVASITPKPPVPVPGAAARSYFPSGLRRIAGLRVVGDVLLRSPLGLPSSLVQDLAEFQPDYVHFHFVHNAAFPRLARILDRKTIPYVVTPNGGLTIRAQARHRMVKRIFAAVVERRYLDRARFLHVVSRPDAEGVEAFGVSNTLVEAPNGIDVDGIPRDVDTTLLRRRFPVLDGKRVAVFVGRLDPEQKGLDLLLRALAGSDGRTALLLIGPDWRGRLRGLERLVDELRVRDRVVFGGLARGREKFDLIGGADYFVHPSRWEAGVPFSVLEALGLGSPCLVTPAADPERRIARSGAGVLVAGDHGSISEGLDDLAARSEAELAEMGRRARDLARSEFSWDAIASTLIRAYDDHR